MAGTDHRKTIEQRPAPAVILVEPQLAENVGATARAMANFGLSELRIVRARPRRLGAKAKALAAGAGGILEAAQVYPSAEAAVADLTLVFATTARERGQAKPVDSPRAAAALLNARVAAGERVGVLFGRERVGLLNDEIALADRVLTFPVNPGFASLNLGQAVLLFGYEWWLASRGEALPFDMPARSPQATKEQLLAFFAHLEGDLDQTGFFRPEDKRAVMVRNLRNIFHRVALSRQDLQTLHGVVAALVEGRRSRERRPRKVLAPLRDEGSEES